MNLKMIALCLLAAPWTAHAQALTDPTRPPATLAVPGGAAPAGEGGPGVEPAATVLQSVLVSREEGGRRIAIINGTLLRQGERYGDALVEKVGQSEVVLRRGNSRETLRLFPQASGNGKPAEKQ